MRYLRVVNVTRDAVLAESAGAATNSKERRTGLLKHTSLAEGEGLWIGPCEAVHTFGMKFVIDVVFIDRKDRVVKVREGMPRRRISGCFTAASVLELPAGTIERTGTARGDQLQLEKLDGLSREGMRAASGVGR
ncbi:MAG TPA: DUF192 domain-containing protein [Bryobacteraceae bacterium]|nr:DUF192 domain-containing protein [Bryobacteraceae bacterium]